MFFFNNAKEEKADFELLYNQLPNDKIKNRIKSTGEWYIKKALFYKRLFHAFSIISIVAPALATALTGMNDGSDAMKVSIIICTSITSVVTSFLAFSKCRDKWTLYRTTIEFIKRELSLYWGGNCGDEMLKDLVTRLEDIIASEQKDWIELFEEMDKGDSKKNNQSQTDADNMGQKGANNNA